LPRWPQSGRPIAGLKFRRPFGRKVFEQQLRIAMWAASLGDREDAQDPDLSFERDRQDITGTDRFGRNTGSPRVDTHMTILDEAHRLLARFDKASEPQPLVEPLSFGRDGMNRSMGVRPHRQSGARIQL